MNGLDFEKARDLLHKFMFRELFIQQLGWENPNQIRPISLKFDGCDYNALPISHLSGVAVFEVNSNDCNIPVKAARTYLQQEISKLHHENLVIFLDRARTQSLWLWVKRENNKLIPREHTFMKGQPGDLFIGKLAAMFVDISEFDEKGNISILDASKKIYKALDIEKTTKKFYTDYALQRVDFVRLIEGIEDESNRRWYASVLLNRLMFVYFLQRKGFIDNGDLEYLQNNLKKSEKNGKDQYFSHFLKVLFFEGFAKPEDKRSDEANRLLGKIRYLNGGLFLPHRLEQEWLAIQIPDIAFENVLKLFSSYSWNLNDTPGGKDNEINPDVLGYIFEKYINQKAFGAYYTRTEITDYLCEHTIYQVILDKVNTPGIPGVLAKRQFDTIDDMLLKLDAPLCKELINEILPKLSLLDPACGSGAFLVAAMKTLINIYSAITGKIEFLGDPQLTQWLQKIHADHPSLAYYIKKQIITNNLFGVDIMPEAAEIAKLRLFLALVASANKVEQLEPLPNIDFNLLTGNSLIGLLRVNEADFDKKYKQGNLFQKSYRQLVDEKKRQLDTYRNTSTYYEDLRSLRDDIETHRVEAYSSLNELLVNEFSNLNIKFEQSTWDEKKEQEGKPIKRGVRLADIEALTPFHWGYEFDDVMNTHGGFDAIITNPPWDIFKPNAKEFFQEFSDLITKNKMSIHDFEAEMDHLVENKEIRDAWFQYKDNFPYQSQYFRNSATFTNQISIIDGKKTGSDINLYKLFVEQCFNLLRDGGLCGMVIPSGIHTDLGTLQLRKLLFEKTQVKGLFGFENRKAVFEGVDSRFKFDILTYQKGGQTQEFPAAFMRHEVSELAAFPMQRGINIQVGLIKHLSPDSWSVMEFKDEIDKQIAEKMLRFPLLGEEVDGKRVLKLTAEFHMTNDSNLFKTQPGPGRLPLYEGKMIYQFDAHYAEPRYWVDEKEARKALLGRDMDIGQQLDYQEYRLGVRAIARSTDAVTIISCITPHDVFCGNSLLIGLTQTQESNYLQIICYLTSLLNSYVLNYYIRNMVSANINMFYLYQLPTPRFINSDHLHLKICKLAASLVCTSPEFDVFAKSVGLSGNQAEATDPADRARLRAELDAIVAHLYGLTEEEFAHVLSTFPIVKEEVKQAAMKEFLKG